MPRSVIWMGAAVVSIGILFLCCGGFLMVGLLEDQSRDVTTVEVAQETEQLRQTSNSSSHAATADDQQEPSQHVLGSWLNETPPFEERITIYRQGRRWFAETTYKDGSSGLQEIEEIRPSNGRRFRDKKGGFDLTYVIRTNGDLQLWDTRAGKQYDMKRFQKVLQQIEAGVANSPVSAESACRRASS